jgi:hypothetical protein
MEECKGMLHVQYNIIRYNVHEHGFDKWNSVLDRSSDFLFPHNS